MNPSWRMDGLTVLVTGASSGLGRQFALTLAGAGARLVVAARRQDALASLAADIERLGTSALPVALDVTDRASVTAAFDRCDAAGVSIDVLVNNAGVAVTKPFLEQDDEDWDRVFDTNLKGAFRVGQQAARRWVRDGRPGCIVNVASITGLRPAGGVAPYAASKAALLHLTRCMALELARHEVRVNALAPGYIETELNREFLASAAGDKLRARVPSRRFGTPDDLSGPLLLLAGPAGRHLTGTVLAADGGHLVSGL